MQHSVIRSLILRWVREGGGVGFYILISYLLVSTLRLEWVMVYHSAHEDVSYHRLNLRGRILECIVSCSGSVFLISWR